jgi:hypothetical protein
VSCVPLRWTRCKNCRDVDHWIGQAETFTNTVVVTIARWPHSPSRVEWSLCSSRGQVATGSRRHPEDAMGAAQEALERWLALGAPTPRR